MTIAAIAADVTGGGNSLLLQAIGESTQAHHQVFNNGSVVLGETCEHRPSSEEFGNPKVFFRVRWVQILPAWPVCGFAHPGDQPSARVHQPSAGPKNRTVTQNSTRAAMPIQAPRVVT